jgi:hypothetical protein
MIIEYGHVYVEDINNGTIDMAGIAKSISLAQALRKSDSIMVVLIDDKAFSLNDQERSAYRLQVEVLYESLGLKPNDVFFEKDFSAGADAFINSLPGDRVVRETFRKQQKSVFFFKAEGRKIPLATHGLDGVSFSCQVLSSMWRHFKGETLSKEANRHHTLTILDKKYIQVERDVERLSAFLQSAHPVQHHYQWY